MVSISNPIDAVEAQPAEPLQRSWFVWLAAHLPWNLKKTIWANPTAWRVLSGLARRTGWHDKAFGWYRPCNGPLARVRLYAGHPNDLGVPLGLYEPEFSELFVKVLRSYVAGECGPVVWDVGAFEGYMSLIGTMHGASRVLAFEPCEENRRRLARNTKANQALAPRITICPVALSATCGTVELRSDSDMTQIMAEGVRIWSHRLTQGIDVVECRTADDYVASGAPVPDFMKIDVEGAEALVLRGACGVLRNHRPIVLLEIHNRAAAEHSFAILRQADYEVLSVSTAPTFECAEIIDYGHVLAVPREKKPSIIKSVRAVY
jgi:FkbM family methyltransferase